MLAGGNPQLLAETTTMPLTNPSLFVGNWGARINVVVLDWSSKAKIANMQVKRYSTTTNLV